MKKTNLVFVLALALGIYGCLTSPQLYLKAYLFSFIFWLAVSLGASAVVLLGFLTGGSWTERLNPFFAPMIKILRIAPLFFIPVLAGARWIFPWATASHENLGAHKLQYFNPVYFSFRACVYLFIWWVIARRIALSLEREGRRT